MSKNGKYDICDHKSVGLVVFNKEGKILLIERKNYPIAVAPPAGHLDGLSFKAAAKYELRHETGLEVVKMKLLLKTLKDNPCRRSGGFDHYWKIFMIEKYEGKIKSSTFEAKKVFWASLNELEKFAKKTESFAQKHRINMYNLIKLTQVLAMDEEWNENPGIEPVWYHIFYELGYLD